MDIIQIIVFCLIATLLYILLKDLNEPFAFLLIIITSLIVLFFIFDEIRKIIDLIINLGERASIDQFYMDTILKIIGIAYIAEIGASIVKDAGLSSVAAKIELIGKIFILILAVPIITAVIEAILNFLPLSS